MHAGYSRVVHARPPRSRSQCWKANNSWQSGVVAVVLLQGLRTHTKSSDALIQRATRVWMMSRGRSRRTFETATGESRCHRDRHGTERECAGICPCMSRMRGLSGHTCAYKARGAGQSCRAFWWRRARWTSGDEGKRALHDALGQSDSPLAVDVQRATVRVGKVHVPDGKCKLESV